MLNSKNNIEKIQFFNFELSQVTKYAEIREREKKEREKKVKTYFEEFSDDAMVKNEKKKK